MTIHTMHKQDIQGFNLIEEDIVNLGWEFDILIIPGWRPEIRTAFNDLIGTFVIWTMVMVGGSGNNKGAVLGALVVIQETRKGEAPMKPLLIGSTLAGVGLVAMILARDQIKRGTLAAAGYEIPAWVEPRWGQLTVFLLLLVGAAVTIIWMVRKLAVGKVEG